VGTVTSDGCHAESAALIVVVVPCACAAEAASDHTTTVSSAIHSFDVRDIALLPCFRNTE
jgi:hypothetical protein